MGINPFSWKKIEKGRQEGRQEGLVSAIELGLGLKFGADGLELLPEISPIRDLEVLSAIKEGIKKATTIALQRRRSSSLTLGLFFR